MAVGVVEIVIAIVFVVVYFKYRSNRNGKGLKEIPGPKGLPLVGNLFQMSKYPNDQFTKWTKEFGPIYKVKLAQFTTVVVSDPKLSKEIFSTEPAFTGKPQFDGFSFYLDDSDLGIFNSEGELWEVHRRFLLRQLRDFGFGKSTMESMIEYEVQKILEKFRKRAKEGKPIGEIRDTLKLAVVNALWCILTSKRFDHDDPELNQLTKQTTEVSNELLEDGGLLIFMPWLRHIIPGWSGYNKARAAIDENRRVFEKVVNEHKAEFQEDNLKDFIDVYLAEVKKTTDPNSVFYGRRAERHLVASLFDLFLAGTDTTASTISWTVLYLCKFTHVQKKLQKEIDEIVGSRKPSVTDKPNMPYTMALMDEVLRLSSIAPDGVQHRALADREFHGYFIPKGTWIQPNLHWIHHNPELWEEPEEFRPERFLSPDGKKYIKSENLQAFQVGRRQCVGETLARDSVFLYVTNLFQQFDMEFNPKEPEHNLGSEVGFLRAPLPYSVIMKERSS